MKRATLLILALAAFVAPSPAAASFGLHGLDFTATNEDGTLLSEAGRHPYAIKVDLAANTRPEPQLGINVPDQEVKNLTVTQITGLAGKPDAVPPCATLDFLNEGKCPEATRLGTVSVTIGDENTVVTAPVFNLAPPPGSVAKFGFLALGVLVTTEAQLEPEPPYDIVAHVTNIVNEVGFYSAELTLWGNPAAHLKGEEAGAHQAPFLTLPRACEGPLATTFQALSWQGSFFEQSILTHNDSEPPAPQGLTDCGKLAFGPEAAAKPTSDQAESPSGLDFNLDIEDEGLANPDGAAASDIKKATVALPEGVTLNPSIAEGLATCSPAQYAAEQIDTEPGEGCPQASKVGTVEAETPLLGGTVIKGSLFVATENENPFHSLIALYMVLREPQKGILAKFAGKVTPNPKTGQIETTFGEPGQELIQEPLSHVRIHLREGGRSPLITPPTCGAYTTEATFTPWADPAHPLSVPSSFEITKGVGGGPCPSGPPPFEPGFEAGTLSNDAGAHSTMDLRLTRPDGNQDLTKFAFTLPPGLLGGPAGISRCPEAQIAAARSDSGRAELASPSCPANSQIGTTLAGAGVGSELTYVPGKLYLAGPFGGDPLSAVAITPAVAGPFDVGTVVVRVGLNLDPRTGQVEADASHSEPIPHILAGIPLKVKDVRVSVNRPNFILNPTNCDPFSVQGTIWGGGTDLFSQADDSPVNRSVRFQAADCARLGFKPALTLRLKGGTRRGSHPALRSVVTPRGAGDANFKEAVVTLPRSSFLDQAHIRTICTRVQFAAHACPAAAIYGHAKAWSPLLDEPAEGPVYLRSSNHNLPDLVVALKGPPSAEVEVEIDARIDSHKGGIRASFESIPDVPVSRFILDMQGGKKGLIVNSRNLCANPSLAIADLAGQNGRNEDFNPPVRPSGCHGANQRHPRHNRR